MTSTMDINDQDFLSTLEKMKIQELYEDWVTYTDCDLLIPKLYSRFIITQHQKQVALSKVTTYDRNDYLHDVVLSRATYSTIRTVRNTLIDMARCSKDRNDTQFTHLHKLITMLPSRESDDVTEIQQLLNTEDAGDESLSSTLGDRIRRSLSPKKTKLKMNPDRLQHVNNQQASAEEEDRDEITKLKEVIRLQNQDGVNFCSVNDENGKECDDEITKLKQLKLNTDTHNTSSSPVDENLSNLNEDGGDNLCGTNHRNVAGENVYKDEFSCNLTLNDNINLEKNEEEIQQEIAKDENVVASIGDSDANAEVFVSCNLTLNECVKSSIDIEENIKKTPQISKLKAESLPLKTGSSVKGDGQAGGSTSQSNTQAFLRYHLQENLNPVPFFRNECEPTCRPCDRCVKSKYLNRLRAYPTPEGLPHGKGMVVFIANCTEIIDSHMKDCDSLTKFFVGKLSYEMSGIHMNPSKKQLMLILTDIQTKLNEANPPYDRFVFFWSTRGFPGGYQTNPNKDGSKAEMFAKVSTKELTSMFTHDKVPSMKDKPKLFFIQAAANNVTLPTKEKKVVAVGGEPERPLDLDILVCHGAKVGTCTFYIPETGSWFIQNMIRVFNQFYKTEHVLDMITEVNRCIGRKKKKHGYISTLKKCVVDEGAFQLIDISHNLSYKLYL